MRIDQTIWSLFIVGIVASLAHGGASPDLAITAITLPSADRTLSFVQAGRIDKIHFQEGDSVKSGQVLVQMDDAVDRARLEQLKADSENVVHIRAGEASLAQKRVDLAKIEKAAASNAATELEVEHARLDVTIAELSVQLAKFEQGQAQRKYEEAKILLDQKSLKSPMNGTIEKIEVEVGESVDASVGVVRVVQVDPFWIDVPVPMVSTADLRRGNRAKVRFPGPKNISADGTIIFVAAVADAASNTLRVRVEVPNKIGRTAGEHVEVIFPAVKDEVERIKK